MKMNNDLTEGDIRNVHHLATSWGREASRSKSRFESVHFAIANQLTYESLVDEIQYFAPVSPSANILEVGCGNGLLIEQFSKRGYTHITGCDLVEELVDQARHSLPLIPFDVLDAGNLYKYEDNKFDFVYTHSIFHYFPSESYTKKVILELFRVVKPKGRIMLLDILGSYWKQWYEKPNVKTKFKNIIKKFLKQEYKIHTPYFTAPELFFETLKSENCLIYPLLEVINKKPITFKQFRYNVLIEKR